jgi:hypothetical protein
MRCECPGRVSYECDAMVAPEPLLVHNRLFSHAFRSNTSPCVKFELLTRMAMKTKV